MFFFFNAIETIFSLVFAVLLLVFFVLVIYIITKVVKRSFQKSQPKQAKVKGKEKVPEKVDPIVYSSESTATTAQQPQKRNANKQKRRSKKAKLFDEEVKKITKQTEVKNAPIPTETSKVQVTIKEPKKATAPRQHHSALHEQLANPQKLSQAFILKELLGKPVSMRK